MKKSYSYIIGFLLLLSLTVYVVCLPTDLFDKDLSYVLEDREGHLLGARIASDGQWRFPMSDSIPEVFEKAVLCFEDKRFYSHPGVDLRAVARAMKQNITAGKIESGASTITMQVMRMALDNPPRTGKSKIVEMILATRLELKYDKTEILKYWSTYAPMGGNVVGLEAASWRYYGKAPQLLSQSEAATLAVLPNAPSLMHPGKNRDALRKKRDRLLLKMLRHELIDSLDYELALLEDIPRAPSRLPQLAAELLDYMIARSKKESIHNHRFRTSIDYSTQQSIRSIANSHHHGYKASDIQNLAVLVLDVETGQVLSYVGNAPNATEEESVDMIQARRSSGSVLKPFLYASLIDAGGLSPKSLVEDVPIQRNGFRPSNYNKSHSGAVPADIALARSLNIPAVNMLQEYRVDKFLTQLKNLGFTSINESADHYGLSLILGGAEINLWELCAAYGKLAKTQSQFVKNDGKYINFSISDYPTLSLKQSQERLQTEDSPVLSAGAIFHMTEAMKKLQRPSGEGQWDQFYSQRPISWKTGTSYGHRDAWAVGYNAKYVIGVWVGNADGEGKSSLVGVKRAAPLFFDVLNRLDDHRYLETPHDDLEYVTICKHSYYRAGAHCEDKEEILVARSASQTEFCPFHEQHFVNSVGERVMQNCQEEKLEAKSFFVLPAKIAHYYQKYHPEYQGLPAVSDACLSMIKDDALSLVYPDKGSSIYLPVNGNGSKESAVVRAVHSRPEAKVYWHLDDQFLGMTEGFHELAIFPEKGTHLLTLIDDTGIELRRNFEVIY